MFCASDLPSEFFIEKNIEKRTEIEDFGLSKPSQNPSKIDVQKNLRFLQLSI